MCVYIYKCAIALGCSIIERGRERADFTLTRYFIGGIIDDIIDVTPTQIKRGVLRATT